MKWLPIQHNMKYQRIARNFMYLAVGIACGQILFEVKVKLFGGFVQGCLLAVGWSSGYRMEPMLYGNRNNPTIPPPSNIYLGLYDPLAVLC